MLGAGVDAARGLAIAQGLFKLNPETSLKAMVYHDDMPELPAKARRLLIRAASKVTELPKVERLSRRLTEERA